MRKKLFFFFNFFLKSFKFNKEKIYLWKNGRIKNANKFVVESFRANALADEASEDKDRATDAKNIDPVTIILQILIAKIKTVFWKGKCISCEKAMKRNVVSYRKAKTGSNFRHSNAYCRYIIILVISNCFEFLK